MAEWQRVMSSKEFAEWRAFDITSPGEPERSDLQAALVSHVIANVNRDKKKRARPFALSDFLLRFDVKERQHHSVLKAKILTALAAVKGMAKREKKNG